MTPPIISRFAFASVFSFALAAAAQTPPTAGFPVEPAPSSSGSAPAPAPSANAPAAPSSAPPPAPVAPPAATTSAPPAPTAPVRVEAPPANPAPAPVTAPPPAPAASPIAAPGALDGIPPPDDGEQLLRPPSLLPEISFERSPGWAVEADARGGIGVLAGSDTRGAFAFLGGLLRAHYQYFELGGFFDHSDSTASGGKFFHTGGFAGAWLPYRNWVDFEAALGFGVRRYSDSDTRYGANGYAVTCPALSLALGVSDRARSGNAGARVGGQLVFTEDFGQKDKAWTITQYDSAGQPITTNGSSHIGGFSASLVFTLGFDYGQSP